MKILDFSEELKPLTAEETYQVFMNTLQLCSGFGIIFLQCSPGETNRLIPRVRRELPEKNIEVLDLVEPIDNLHRLVAGRADRDSLDVLFVRGLEKSLEADIKPGYKGLGDYYNLNTIPPVLSHLNQQRENFRDHFSNICFVFVLPKFAIRYFVRRAPDFYDWNSGVFEISDLSSQGMIFASEDIIISGAMDNINLISIISDKLVNDVGFAQVMLVQGNGLFLAGRYEEAIAVYDRAIEIKPDLHEAWYSRGNSLHSLGRYEEAIKSYGRAISFKPDYHEAWDGRGNSLGSLGIYEEAIKSYDRAISFKPDNRDAWHDKSFAYFKWGKYSESIKSYDQAITIKPDGYNSWHDKGVVHFVTSDFVEALTSWQEAFKYISDSQVPRYYKDISRLIQVFIEELIPRFTQPPIQQTLLVPLLEIYQEANVITELGSALVNTLHLIVAPAISDHTAAQWLELWRTSSLGTAPAMELPLRLMSIAIEYKKDPSKRDRLWLNLPSEERPILDQALQILD